MQCAKHQMSRKRSLYGDLCGLDISNFTNHHDVGVLPKEGTQNVGKRVSHAFLNRHLNDALHIVFNRLFSSQNLVLDRIDAFEAGIERRRLSRSRRAGHNHNAVGFRNVAGEPGVHIIRHPQILDR